MGKARIDSHLGSGLYNITYIRDVSLAAARLTEIAAQRQALDDTIYKSGGIFDQIVDAEIQTTAATSSFEQALSAWEACAKDPACKKQDELKAAMVTAAKAKMEARGKYIGLMMTKSVVQAKRLSLLSEVSLLQSRGVDREFSTRQAYSVDLPDDETNTVIPSSTDVGTIELWGASGFRRGPLDGPDPHILIRPNHDGSAGYIGGRDHKCQPMAGQTTSTSIYNILEFPLVAIHKPQYHLAVVLSKEPPTMTVETRGLTPTTGEPHLFKPKILSGVAVQYMSCDHLAFKVGDKVVVEMGASPKVIGFANGPKPCPILNGWKISGGQYIRESWQGTNNGWVWYSTAAGGGNTSWRGTGGRTVSWDGLSGKHVGYPTMSSVAYYNGVAYNFGDRVKGACRRKSGNKYYIYAVCDNGLAYPNNGISVRRVEVGTSTLETLWSENLGFKAIWGGNYYSAFFNHTGTAAIFAAEDSLTYGWGPTRFIQVSIDGGSCGIVDLNEYEASVSENYQYTLVPHCENDMSTVALGSTVIICERAICAEFSPTGKLLLGKVKLTFNYSESVSTCQTEVSPLVGTLVENSLIEVTVDGAVVATSSIDKTVGRGYQTTETGTERRQRLIALDLNAPENVGYEEVTISFSHTSGQARYESRSAVVKLAGNTIWSGGGSFTAPSSFIYTSYKNELPTGPYYSGAGLLQPGWAPGLTDVFIGNSMTPSSDPERFPSSTAFQMAHGPDGKYIAYFGSISGSGTLSNSQYPAKSCMSIASAAPWTFISNDISQSQYEAQSGKSLPYQNLGVI